MHPSQWFKSIFFIQNCLNRNNSSVGLSWHVVEKMIPFTSFRVGVQNQGDKDFRARGHGRLVGNLSKVGG
jgi:hypothetical protein